MEQKILDEIHTNKFEHRQTLFKFVSSFVFYGFLGNLLGGLLNYCIVKIQGENPKKLNCAFTLLYSLGILGVIFFVALKVKKGILFDDWLYDTFVGFIFAVTFFNAFQSLSENSICLFK